MLFINVWGTKLNFRWNNKLILCHYTLFKETETEIIIKIYSKPTYLPKSVTKPIVQLW